MCESLDLNVDGRPHRELAHVENELPPTGLRAGIPLVLSTGTTSVSLRVHVGVRVRGALRAWVHILDMAEHTIDGRQHIFHPIAGRWVAESPPSEPLVHVAFGVLPVKLTNCSSDVRDGFLLSDPDLVPERSTIPAPAGSAPRKPAPSLGTATQILIFCPVVVVKQVLFDLDCSHDLGIDPEHVRDLHGNLVHRVLDIILYVCLVLVLIVVVQALGRNVLVVLVQLVVVEHRELLLGRTPRVVDRRGG
mmetsp:Transcript_1422/g.3529  ORF Transcript_1422/g.3529 Transcript_1422/m.3529 type:complete len:248 (-) Transcript_1422:472-1215(-)